MRVLAVVVGSYGDVRPFIALGRELRSRGNQFGIAAFAEFAEPVRAAGLEFHPVQGRADALMSELLGDSKGPLDSVRGLRRALNRHPRLFEELAAAVDGQDVVVYMQFGALAYHLAEATGVPCLRAFVYPFDPTRRYSLVDPRRMDGTFGAAVSYHLFALLMNWASLPTARTWRRRLGLPGWHLWSSYRRQRGRPVPTLYQFSEVLVPRDRSWGPHIHITGDWTCNEPVDAQVPEGLEAFLHAGGRPVVVSFGSVQSALRPKITTMVLAALDRLDLRAILVGGPPVPAHRDVFCCDFLPFGAVLDRCRGIVHHGGLGTVSAAMRSGCPSLVVAFGGDQQFHGQRIADRGAGPAIIDLQRDAPGVDLCTERLQELIGPQCRVAARQVADELAGEHGVTAAAEVVLATGSAPW